MTARQNQPFPATPASAKPAGEQPTRFGLSLALGLVLAAGAVGCSGSKGAESQFHASDGTTASLIFYVGHQLPSDDPRLAEDARGKVLACWYRSDVLLNQVDQAIARGSITTEQAHAAFFARGNTHNRLTRFPSLCEDVPRQASRSLGVSTDFTPMCNPGFDKVNAINEQNTTSMNLIGNLNLGNLLGQVILGGVGNWASRNPNNTFAQVANAGAPFVTNLVTSRLGSGGAQGAQGSTAPMTADRALLAMAGAGIIQTEARNRPNNPFLTLAGGLTPLLQPDADRSTSGILGTAATAAGGAFGDENGQFRFGNVSINPADLSGVFASLFPNRNAPASPAGAAPAASEPPANSDMEAPPPPGANTSASPASQASPSTTSSPDMASSDFEKAHPKVEMDQLNRIARDVARRVGTSPNVILANRSLTFSECPEIGQ